MKQHAPASERTQGMIGARELAMMRPTSYLVNCARGELINEDDLVEALCEGEQAAD